MIDFNVLPLTELDNLYYLESLSFDDLPDNGAAQISDKYIKMTKTHHKIIKNYFRQELSVLSPPDPYADGPKFLPHDLSVEAIKILDNGTAFILNGYSYSDQEKYCLEFNFEHQDNVKIQKSTYNKGLLSHRGEQTIGAVDLELNTLNMRDIVFVQDEKLDNNLSIVF